MKKNIFLLLILFWTSGCGQILVSTGISPFASYERQQEAFNLILELRNYLKIENLEKFDVRYWEYRSPFFCVLIYSDGEFYFSEKQINEMKALIPPDFPIKEIFIMQYNKNLPENANLSYNAIQLR